MKELKDKARKLFTPRDYVPEGLVEMQRYSRLYGGIHFETKKEEGMYMARSTNFRYGSIVTSAKSEQELDKNIRDAILTAFSVPSSYAPEAGIHRVGEKQEYVPA